MTNTFAQYAIGEKLPIDQSNLKKLAIILDNNLSYFFNNSLEEQKNKILS